MKHIGIFRISNKKIYIDFEENKLVGYYYYKEKKEYLNLNQILGLIEELFIKKNLQFLREENGYEVFKDKNTEFLHFFKDDKEDYFKFFLENGHSAMLNSRNKGNIIDKFTAKFFINKKTRNEFIFTLYLVATISLAFQTSLPTVTNIKQEIEIRKYSSEQIIEDAIYSSDNLSLADKQLLQNEELFEKISQVKIDYDRVESLVEKLDNIYIEEFTKEEKEAEKEKNEENISYTTGYYNPLIPNSFKLLDLEDEDTKVHEFIHLLQESNCYSYLTEAITEIIKKEYYQDKIKNYSPTYYSQQIRIKVLMEIINPEIIWDMMYTGNTEEFENAINSLLSKEDAELFLTSLYESVADKKEKEKTRINSTIDRLLGAMYQNKYNESIKNNEVISLIYDEEGIVIENNRRYFNDAKNKENRNDFYINTFPSLDSISEKDGNYEILIELNYPEETISKEEFEKGVYNNFNNSDLNKKEKTSYYTYEKLKENSNWYNTVDLIFKNTETGEEVSFEELVKRGETERVYLKNVSRELSIKEAEDIINDYATTKNVQRMSASAIEVGNKKNITINVKNKQASENYDETVLLVLKNGKYKICLHGEQEIYCPPIVSEKKYNQHL